MAKLTPSNKAKIFRQLNERNLPWPDSKFIFTADNDYEWLGSGGFSEVVVMEDCENPDIQYAVKVIGLSEHRRVHSTDIKAYKQEPVLQSELAKNCQSVLKIIDTEVLYIKINNNCEIEDVKMSSFEGDITGWLVLVMIKMERLIPIVEQNISGDYSFTMEKLKQADEKTVLSLAIDIAEALTASHNMDIMHRDVKPENIFYDEKSGKFKLGDFGIARITNQGSASTKGAGTMGYEAPEVANGNDEKYSYQADIYSFGITLYLILNDLKFPGSDEYYVNRAVQYNPDSEIAPPAHGSPRLKALVCDMIKYRAEERPVAMVVVSLILKQIKLEMKRQEKALDNKADTVNVAYPVPDFGPVKGDGFGAPSFEAGVKPGSSDAMPVHKDAMPNTSYSMPVHAQDTGVVLRNAEAKPEKREAKPFVMPEEAETKIYRREDLETVDQTTYNKQKEASAPTKEITKKEAVLFGIMMFAVPSIIAMFVGLLFLRIVTQDVQSAQVGNVTFISLIIYSVFAVVAMLREQIKRKDMPYFIYFLLSVSAVVVLFIDGANWLYVVLAVALLFARNAQILAVLLAMWVSIILPKLAFAESVYGFCNEKYAWIFYLILLLGFWGTEFWHKKDDMLGVLLYEPVGMLFIGVLSIVFGIVTSVLKLIPAISVASIFTGMHPIWVGVILLVISFFAVTSTEGGKSKNGNSAKS